MATMVTEVYDALKSAGVDDEKARSAAVAMANYEPRFAALGSDLNLIKWMVGFNLALTVAVLFKLFH